MWPAFVGLILLLLALDLFVFHRDAHEVSFGEATKFSIYWIALGLAFGGLVFVWMGPEAGGEYLAGYLIEKSLAVDNIFVFARAPLLVITAMIGASILVSLRVTAGRDDDLEPGDAEPEHELESVR